MSRFRNQVFIDEPIPADLIVLASSNQATRKLFVETKSLDGETNLKEKISIPHTQEMLDELVLQQQVASNSYEFTFEAPNPLLYTFKGTLKTPSVGLPLDNKHLVLRGCVLKNTDYFLGVVVYCGKDSKIMMNSIIAQNKRSKLETSLSFYIAAMFGVLIICCLACSGLYVGWLATAGDSIAYLQIETDSLVQSFFIKFGSWILSFGNFIPISLIVTVELVKFLQAIMINRDQQLYSNTSHARCSVNSSNLNEELGQINFVLTDKTGTLTCNKMVFRNALIGAKIFGAIIPTDSRPENAKASAKAPQTSLDLDDVRRSYQKNVSIAVPESPQNKPSISVNIRDDFKPQKTLSLGRNPSSNQASMRQFKRKSTNISQQSNYELVQRVKDYVDFKDAEFDELVRTRNSGAVDYLRLLALCHAVTLFKNVYNASSPDELALVIFAKAMGIEFTGLDGDNRLTFTEFGVSKSVELLHLFEFTSARKCMSVIIRNEEGKVVLLTKGADNVMLRKLAPAFNDEFSDSLQSNLDRLSTLGLRTLVLAQRELDAKEYADFKMRYSDAQASLADREEKMEILQFEVEQNLAVVGATALEDRLQDEVPETIAFFRDAGIKVWVLTGDKLETAKSIGLSCGLLTEDMELQELTDTEPDKIRRTLNKFQTKIQLAAHPHYFNSEVNLERCKLSKNCGKCDSCQANRNLRLIIASAEIDKEKMRRLHSKTKFGLLVSGDTLIEVTKDKELEGLLIKAAMKCEVAICCRVSPKQKQEIVKLVKNAVPNACTLAVGDGANDVNMIIEANVGVGIKGVEGNQAAATADYSIGEFKMLRRLVFMYGRECYRKNSHLVLFNFWKNALLVLPQLWYALIYANFTGGSLYDSYLYQLVNVVFTSVPILVYAVYDIELEEQIFVTDPKKFKIGLREACFNKGAFLMWVITAFVQSLMICLICSLCDYQPQPDGSFFGFWGFGMFVFTMIMLIVNIKVLLITNSFNFLTLPIAGLSFGFFLFSFYITNTMSGLTSFGLFTQLFSAPFFYLLGFLVLLACSFFDYLWIVVQRVIFFNNLNITYEFESLADGDKQAFVSMLKKYKSDAQAKKKTKKSVNFVLPGPEVGAEEVPGEEVAQPQSIKDLMENFEAEVMQKRPSFGA